MRMKIAVLLTVFNRLDMTLSCLESLFSARIPDDVDLTFKVFLTDDGSSDGTSVRLKEDFSNYELEILQGTGSLYWNAGMNNSWNTALSEGGFDGYLWLNNDCVLYPNLWEELVQVDMYSKKVHGSGGYMWVLRLIVIKMYCHMVVLYLLIESRSKMSF